MGVMLGDLGEEKGGALEDDEIMKITKAEFDTYQRLSQLVSLITDQAIGILILFHHLLMLVLHLQTQMPKILSWK
jgi:hypothetical protein